MALMMKKISILPCRWAAMQSPQALIEDVNSHSTVTKSAIVEWATGWVAKGQSKAANRLWLMKEIIESSTSSAAAEVCTLLPRGYSIDHATSPRSLPFALHQAKPPMHQRPLWRRKNDKGKSADDWGRVTTRSPRGTRWATNQRRRSGPAGLPGVGQVPHVSAGCVDRPSSLKSDTQLLVLG